MWEFLKQISKIWDDKVETTWEWLHTLADEVDKEEFHKCLDTLSKSLTKKIDDEWLSDEITRQIVENSNDDIQDLVKKYWLWTIKNFDELNEQFSELFTWVNLDEYIDEVKAQNMLTQKSEKNEWSLLSRWVNKSANEIAKNNY